MNLPVHVMAKDLRRYWSLAAFAAAFILLDMLAPLWGVTPAFLNISQDSTLMAITKWPIVFVLVVAVMQEDRTVGDRAFWRTRPIAPFPLLLGKLMMFGLAVAVPAIVANLYIATALDTPGQVALGIAVETTGFTLLTVLCAALAASMTGSLIQAGLAALGGVLAAFGIGGLRSLLAPYVTLHLPWDTDVADPRPRVAFACALACVTLVALLSHQYLTRRTGRTLAILIISVPIILLTAITWNVDVGIHGPRGPVFPDKPLQMTDSITLKMELPAQVFGQFWMYDGTTKRYRPDYNVAVYADLHGAPPGRLFGVAGGSSTLRLKDGREVKLGVPQQWYNFQWGNAEREGAICRALGLNIPLMPADQDPQGLVKIFSLPKVRLDELRGVRGQLTATLLIGEESFREEFLMPARTGASHHEPGQLWRIARISPARDDAALQLDVQYLRATTMFDSGGAARADINSSPFQNRQFFLLNKKLGQFAAGNVYWGNGRLGTVASVVAKIDFTARRRGGVQVSDTPIDDAWLADAQLAVVAIDPVGRTEKTVVVDNFEIPARQE